jgi:uncharacterized protein
VISSSVSKALAEKMSSYTDRTTVAVEEEDNVKTEVNELDVAYWPEGRALCLFYGPTPISKDGKILAYSPVNLVDKIIDSSNKDHILSQTIFVIAC